MKETRFENGATYKLYRKNMELSERVAICTGISRKNKAIRFDIIGTEKENMNKMTIVMDLVIKSDGSEFATSSLSGFKQYLGIMPYDVIAKKPTEKAVSDPKEERQKLVNEQVKVLKEHGISSIETKPMLRTVIVKSEDLERASELKISNEITIASRC